MTDTMERTDIDIAFDEATAEPPKCEATGEHGCTVTAVALGMATCRHDAPVLICRSVVEMYEFGASTESPCSDCGRLVTTCWVIVPI